jgi:hypothetical protein
MLNVIMLSTVIVIVIMLSTVIVIVIMLSTVILIVIILSAIRLIVIMLSAVVVSVAAPDLEIMRGSDEEKKLELEGKKKRQIIADIFQDFITEGLSPTK